MEVITADRPGLLARVGWALANCHISLLNAKIATFGERAEDIFYLCDRGDGVLSDDQVECLRTALLKALDAREEGAP